MTIFVALILTALTFGFIAYPLFKQRSPSVDSVEDDKSQELHSQRDTTYSMLKELEFDLQSDILTEEDYQDLEARYKGKAVSILRDLDNLKKGAELEEEIEKQVLKLRRGKSADTGEKLEKEIQEQRRGKGQFCSQCGAKRAVDDRFCSQCGTSLN
jgi:ribosomal protein L40E